LRTKTAIVNIQFMNDGLVIIPTYNEKENIERIIKVVFSLNKTFDVLIVDDGSPDATGQIVKGLQSEYPDRLFLIEREGKQGLGTAYITGFEWALRNSYEYVFEMDADFSHNPNDLERLYDACVENGADLAIGSRYISGMNVVNWPLGRILISYFASAYVRFFTGMPIKDATAGFKCYRRIVLETIDLDAVRFKGYAFQIEMKFKAYKHGFRLVEVPIVFTNRAEGVSKMSTSIFGEALFGVLQMKWDSLFQKYQRPK
jgi:Glycosyltransferases involved in cell wall biogenesis